ncbi:MAG: c-type cytochrome, partial [Phycisphaerales bacterium]|nr:c-type cytochrome [Phycisphaerales bacterium]
MNRQNRLAVIGVWIALIVTGCGEMGRPLPVAYSRNSELTEKLKDKPKVQARLDQILTQLFGPTPNQMRVPPGAPLPQGGARLASFVYEGETTPLPALRHLQTRVQNKRGETLIENIRGGYGIYREQCMHCHGAAGDGNGPTAPFLWPAPRDYRLGVFKFTSTSGSGPDSKPTRVDLRRTINNGIANTSMPAFQSLLRPDEIERVIDYVIFLSLRGEVEGGLYYLAQDIEDANAETELGPDQVQEVTQLVFDRWKNADANVLDPKTPRLASSAESIARGRELFLGKKGLQCYGCHGLDGKGNGESFVDYRDFVKTVFEGDPSPAKVTALKDFAEKNNKKWGDDWGKPLRPANLTAGVYKGGRRPIDLYWRIAKGINGTPMPVHLGSQLQSDDEVWDIVNFVLALPYDPTLLEDAKPVPGATLTTQSEPASGPLAARS